MKKLFNLFVLYFVIKVIFGNADKNGCESKCSNPNVELTDENAIFSEHVSTPTIDQKILHRLDSLDDSLKVSVNENEKLDAIIASLNSIETLIKYAVKTRNAYPRNCMEATKLTRPSGLYGIQVENYGPRPFKVYCEEELYDGGWTVVARRLDGTIDFANRNWTEYKQGFGELNGEFFIGMEKLYALTNRHQTQELIFVLEDFNDTRKYAKYSEFAIGHESDGYFIKALGNYSGDAGDSFSYHRNQTFKTKDRDTSTGYCTRFGAWWYSGCHESNLFGTYLKGHVKESDYSTGVIWSHWHGYRYSLRFVQMMIRPKCT